jgi:hypothetical protein
VHALGGERVEDDRERRRQRLALAGLHLGDRPVVQDHAADHLDVEVPHVHAAAADLPDEREGLGQELLQRLTLARALAQAVEVLA